MSKSYKVTAKMEREWREDKELNQHRSGFNLEGQAAFSLKDEIQDQEQIIAEAQATIKNLKRLQKIVEQRY